MGETDAKPRTFLGTYFDQTRVLWVSRMADILSWVVVILYILDMLLAITVFILQFARGYMQGVGFTDVATNVLYLMERPFRGIVYFVVLQAISKTLLIFMDMEEDMRRAARQ
jgi:hypothetical protein